TPGAPVFDQIPDGDWTRADTISYIKAHLAEIATESGRPGGDDNINGGGGDDIIYAQEGNDIIRGGLGNDTMSGGSGADHFVYKFSSEGTDLIKDFTIADGDVIDISKAGFGPGDAVINGLTPGVSDVSGSFSKSANDNFTGGGEHFHYNSGSGTLFYDA